MKSELRTYDVVANPSGHLSVRVSTGDSELRPSETVIKSGFRTIDDAFDYRDDLQARIAQLNTRHCDTCD